MQHLLKCLLIYNISGRIKELMLTKTSIIEITCKRGEESQSENSIPINELPLFKSLAWLIRLWQKLYIHTR